MDTRIIEKPDGKRKMVVCRKKTYTGQYLNFQSHHPLHQKLGVFRTLMDRAHAIFDEEEDIKVEEEYIQSSLKTCGHPHWSFMKIQEKGREKQKTKKIQDNQTNQKRKLVTIPYKGTSKALQRIYQKYNISTSFKPHTKL